MRDGESDFAEPDSMARAYLAVPDGADRSRSAKAGTAMTTPTTAIAGARGRTTTRPATASGAAKSAAAR